MIETFLFENIQDAEKYMEKNVHGYVRECCTESFESFDSLNLLAFDFYDIHTDVKQTSKVMIYENRENLLFFCENKRLLEKIDEKLSELKPCAGEDAGHTLYRFFERLMRGDPAFLQNFEQRLNDEEEKMFENLSDFDSRHFSVWRKELLRLKRYYIQLNVIFNDMSDNDNKLLTRETVRRFANLSIRAERFVNNTVNLQETVNQMHDAYRSQLSIRQNELMQFFTIITVIFLPLTLIVGWYGMNFINMPELHWRYGYAGVAVLSAAVVILMLINFKRKKWM